MKPKQIKTPTSITQPLYLYFETDLVHLYHAYHARKQHSIVNQIGEELKQRQAETFRVQFGHLPGEMPKARTGLAKPKQMKLVTLQRIAA